MGSERRSWTALALVAVLAATIVAWLYRLDTSALPEVTRFRDDAYYYFAWARSLLDGGGPCVTPGVATSGVQPLWGGLLVVGGALLGTAKIPAFAHVLGLTLHVMTALAIGASLRRLPAVALGAALLYAGNPYLLTEAQNGQETALACAALFALITAVPRGSIVFAAASLLVVAARSDLFAVVVGLSFFRVGPNLRALVVPAAVLVAYFALNLVLAGHVLPDSARPIPWLLGQRFAAGDPDWIDVARRLWWYGRPCLLAGPYGRVSPVLGGLLVYVALRSWLPERGWWWPAALTGVAALVGAADLGVALTASLAWLALRGEEPRDEPLQPVFLGLVALVVLHYVVRFYPRDYYFAPLGVAGVLAWARIAGAHRRVGALAAIAAATIAIVAAPGDPARRPWQEEMAIAGRALREVVPAGEAVGCFNSGIVTWLHDGRVLNLDGVVNRAAFTALQRGDLDSYLDAQGVRFVVDIPAQFAREHEWVHASGRHFSAAFDPARDLREVARFDVPGVDAGLPQSDSFRLYWRVGRGVAPALVASARDLGATPDRGRLVLWPGRDGAVLEVGALGGAARTRVAQGRDGVAFVIKIAPGAGAMGLFESGSPEPILTWRFD